MFEIRMRIRGVWMGVVATAESLEEIQEIFRRLVNGGIAYSDMYWQRCKPKREK